jgi:SNF family Na+-dependent transporter
VGSGALTAYGSYFNRSSDATGLGVIAVLIGSLGQCVLFLAFALGQSVIHPGHILGSGQGIWGPYAVGSVLANVGWPAWWSAIMTAVWFIALCAFLIAALLALIESVATPIIDKFRIGRERVVPGICLVVFFSSALFGQLDRLPTWSLDGLFSAMVLTMIVQALVAWRAMKLDGITRHLNAYSAFRLNWGWRSSIAFFIPLLGVYLLVDQFLHGNDLIIRLTVIAVTLVVAAVVTRLTGRNR